LQFMFMPAPYRQGVTAERGRAKVGTRVTDNSSTYVKPVGQFRSPVTARLELSVSRPVRL